MQSQNRHRESGRVALVAYGAVFAALALIFSYIEALIPIPIPVPGIKLGIANLVVQIAIYRFGYRYAFAVNCVRIAAAGLLFSGVFGMIYSFAGGILSMTAMFLLYRTGRFSIPAISMAGGVVHNLGQLLTACVLLESPRLISYLSVLTLAGAVTGIVTGIIAYFIDRRLPKAMRRTGK